jgi:hypothetical protein
VSFVENTKKVRNEPTLMSKQEMPKNSLKIFKGKGLSCVIILYFFYEKARFMQLLDNPLQYRSEMKLEIQRPQGRGNFFSDIYLYTFNEK